MKKMRIFLYLLLSCIILSLDVSTKWYTKNYIPFMSNWNSAYPHEGVPVFENILGINFSLNYIINTGAAWGIFSDYTTGLLITRLLCVIGIIVYIVLHWKKETAKLPLIFILAGAIGNIIDLAFYGYVVDMFHWTFWGYHFPVFNIADISVCIGTILLFWETWNTKSNT